MIMEKYMNIAIQEAKKAIKYGDVPVGAVIVKDDVVIAKSYNKKEKHHNALQHAEVLAINKACKRLKSYRLSGCTMYVTFEPCLMCVGAILSARIDKVVFGAYHHRFGACSMLVDHNFNHKTQYVGGVMEQECSSMLTDFFSNLRQKKSQNKIKNNK